MKCVPRQAYSLNSFQYISHLHHICSNQTQILEIVTLRKEGLRGQAWVIFEHVAASTAAIQAEQGFTFFGKDLKIDYAREKSDRVAKLDGTFVPKDRRAKRERAAAEAAAKKAKLEAANEASAAAESNAASASSQDDPSSLTVKEGVKTDEGASSAPAAPGAPPPSTELPSNILFAQALPTDCNEMMLAMLFRQYPGYKEVRIPRPGLAFVEFDDEPHASVALKALNGFKLTANETLDLKYGKA